MALSVRPKPYALPSYSLTGDLIGFLRCGLQYRYTRIGKLPSSRPIQLWFGEYVHGVMEEAFRRYRESARFNKLKLPPWQSEEILSIQDLIKKRLASRGLKPWNDDVELLADRRTEVAIQEMGPHLFPLINKAEVRLFGARALPQINDDFRFRETDRYEMVGVVDVLTHIELNNPEFASNLIVQEIKRQIGKDILDKFEIIIDYKGMRRQGNFALRTGSLWEQYEWQIQTYAELRRKQSDALPVYAGILLYINELAPSQEDLAELKKELTEGTTDVIPPSGSEAQKVIESWTMGKKTPQIPLDFRIQRAMRVVKIDSESIKRALSEFDRVVHRIESCRGKEFYGIGIIDSWERNPHDPETCKICDARTYCPDYKARYAHQNREPEPRIPGER